MKEKLSFSFQVKFVRHEENKTEVPQFTEMQRETRRVTATVVEQRP